MLVSRLQAVRERIGRACRRAGRNPDGITLVAVTKQVAVEQMREAVAAGLRDLGENRVQEARAKQAALGLRIKGEGEIRWHLIGHLQRNKAKHAVELFDVIHSVDSVELVEELEHHAATGWGGGIQPLEVFVQINVSGETTKFGCAPAEAPKLCQAVLRQPHLKLAGLMTIAPLVKDPEQARPYFRHLRCLRDEVAHALPLAPRPLPLSMGMSNDFEVAIEEGADVVRIGTAIFGGRGRETGGGGMVK